jgi:pimeloyl-ACP methyl ester carboxylesterase
MNFTTKTNITYTGAKGRLALLDFHIPNNWNKEVLIFMHGFMGFKDWGCWNLMERFFLEKGYGFCKFNVSHNGTILEDATSIVDIKAFSENTYSYELEDLNAVINWVNSETLGDAEISLIGHSRGGGMVLLAAHHQHVKKVITLAAISDIESRFPNGEQLEFWKENRLLFVHNGRTKQKLPMKYLQYMDFMENKAQLNIESRCRELSKPLLILHGSDDPNVLPENAHKIAEWSGNKAIILNGASHTFGASHPWNSMELPRHLNQVCEEIIHFTTG